MVDAPKGEDVELVDDKRDIYSKILNSAPTFMGKHEEGLLMNDQTSKVDEENAPKMELKPLLPHLSYYPNQAFPIVVSTKFNDVQFEKLFCVL